MTKDITPEHTKRGSADHGSESNSPLHPEIKAAYDYVDSVGGNAFWSTGYGVAWNGWSLREAFLAGINYAQSQAAMGSESKVLTGDRGLDITGSKI